MPAIAFPTTGRVAYTTESPWTDASGNDWTWSVAKSRWSPVAAGTSLTAGTGIDITGGVVSSTVTGNATHTGDVTGATALTVALVGGVTASNVAAGATLANAATDANTVSTLVKRDASGNFTAGTITAALTGNATTSSSTTGNAATVTTNANLTGHITSVGNATVLGSFTLAQLDTATSDATLARTDAGQTFAGAQAFASTTRPTSSGTGTPAATSLITNDDLLLRLASPGAIGGTVSSSGAFTTIKSPVFFPVADSVSSLKICKADGVTDVISIDTTNSRIGIGTSSPGYPLHIERNINASTSAALMVKNSSGGNSATAEIRVENNLNYSSRFFKLSSAYTTYKTLTANGMGFYNDSLGGNIAILNDSSAGNITLTAGGSSTSHVTIASSGETAVASTLTALNFKRGTGTPEAAVVGSMGDIFIRTNGGAGTTLYIKESGNATNPGWVSK